MITLNEINLISAYISYLTKRSLFHLLWSQMKKQDMFLDPSKVIVEYESKELLMGNQKVNAPCVIIRREGYKGFTLICPDPIHQAKYYRVLFLKYNRNVYTQKT